MKIINIFIILVVFNGFLIFSNFASSTTAESGLKTSMSKLYSSSKHFDRSIKAYSSSYSTTFLETKSMTQTMSEISSLTQSAVI